MRARLILLVLVTLAVAGFAALNWPEFQRTAPLNFGVFTMEAALGAILLTLLAIGLLAFLVSSSVLRSRMMITENRFSRDLQVQRDLADKAEASRFTELRQFLDGHFRETHQREAMVSTELEKSMVQSLRELRSQVESMNHMLARRLGEADVRADTRTVHEVPVVDVPATDVPPPARGHVKA